MQVLIIDNDIAYRNGVSMAASNKHWIPVSCGDMLSICCGTILSTDYQRKK